MKNRAFDPFAPATSTTVTPAKHGAGSASSRWTIGFPGGSPTRLALIAGILVTGMLAQGVVVAAPAQADPRGAASTPQSAAQQKCINALNKAGAKLAKAQSKETATCLKNFSLGSENDPEACLTRDDKGKINKATTKTTGTQTKSCTQTPDFGASSAAAVNNAAIDEAVQLTHDVLGLTFPAANLSCQASVMKSYDKILQTKLKVFLGCKKAGLKNESIDSAAALEGCFDAIADDTKGKIAKAITKLDGTITKSCGGENLDSVFPGRCIGALDLATCLDQRVECRACQMLNAMDGLNEDCDLFDDGLTNLSCLPAGTIESGSWSEVFTEIIEPTCSGCHHGGVGGLAGLGDCDQGHTNMVNVPSTELPSMDRVEPGDPALSWLMHKLDGTQSAFTAMCVGNICGDQMPVGGALSLAERESVRLWIAAGATNDCP